jgi:hypothetical protein
MPERALLEGSPADHPHFRLDPSARRATPFSRVRKDGLTAHPAGTLYGDT